MFELVSACILLGELTFTAVDNGLGSELVQSAASSKVRL